MLILLTVFSLFAAPADTTLHAGPARASFDEARALGVDPAGRVYVADAGADVVVRLVPRAGVLIPERLGGPGSDAGQFYEPADVDPTNGQVLLVADAGNSRVQRFSRAFAHIETLPLGQGYDAAGAQPARPVYDAGEEDANTFGQGRPVAVATTGADVTYALDADAAAVVRWDASRRAERVVGGFGRSDGRLRDPVALAVGGEDLLFVADQAQGAVLVYDTFGRYVRTAAQSLGGSIQALTVHAGRLWVVLPRRLVAFDPETGRREDVLRVTGTDGPVVDAGFGTDGSVYLLTPEALYHVQQ